MAKKKRKAGKVISKKEVQKVARDIQNATKELHKATEAYLHATVELAKLSGSKTWKKVKPHVLKMAKSADNLHKRLVKK